MRYRSTLACGVAVIAISAAAQASAQTNGSRDAAAGSASVEEVGVTGSRAIRDGARPSAGS